MSIPNRILVPTDFSEACDAAKVYATALAGFFGARLHVLHVIPDPFTPGWGVDNAHLPLHLERRQREVRRRLETLLPAKDRDQIDAELAVEAGSPSAVIADYVNKHDIDLIVMGTHGRSALVRMWAGSVTKDVLHLVRCPVVIVHEAQY
jgi:nucleotide-binding universal stress UspA family protein